MIRRRTNEPFSPDHDAYHRPFMVANAERAKAKGETAFRFWYGQRTIPLDMLARRTKIESERLHAFSNGSAKPTAEEAEILAPFLKCQPSDLTD